MSEPSTVPYFVAPEMFPESGGPFKSVGLFRESLGGRIVSPTTNASAISKANNPDCSYVYSSQLHWLYGDTKRQMVAELQGASLISCHLIFRGHDELCRQVAARMKIPYWAVPHGGMDPWVFTYGKLQKKLWYKLIGERFFKEARFVILATEREKQKMAERYNGQNMVVVHWPVEPMDVSTKESVRSSFRQQLGIDPAARILLFFGRYHSMKRPLETIRYFKAANLNERVHLVMAGIDYNITREQLQHEAGSLNDKQVHVLGPVYGDDRLKLLLAADAYISLSIRENFNHTAAEAMSSGLALILSPGNDLQYSFPTEGAFGWNLTSDREDEAINAMRRFAESEDDSLKEMGNRARNWSLADLSFERFKERLTKLARESCQAV